MESGGRRAGVGRSSVDQRKQRTRRTMTTDLDVYRSAKALIDQHGEFEAKLHAAMRADELLEAGDMDGRRVWLRVLEAVRELTSKEPPGEGAAVH